MIDLRTHYIFRLLLWVWKNSTPQVMPLLVTLIMLEGSSLHSQNAAPIANCHSNVALYFDSLGSAILQYSLVDSVSFDDTAIVNFTLSQSSFNCPPNANQLVVLTVMDGSGLTDSCTSLITTIDTTLIARCDSFTLQLDPNTSVTLAPGDVDGGSTSACGIQSMSVFPNTFAWTDTVPQTVTLTVANTSAISATCTAVVTPSKCKSYFTNNGPCYLIQQDPNACANCVELIPQSGQPPCQNNAIQLIWNSTTQQANQPTLPNAQPNCTAYQRKGCTIMVYDPSATLVCPCPRFSPDSVACGSSCSITCSGGLLPLLDPGIVGGVPPLSYQWNTSATTSTLANVQAGTYSLTVTDGFGNQFIFSFCIIAPQAIILSATITPSCSTFATGMIDLHVAGGCGNFSYLWSNGVTTEDLLLVNSGPYSVTATDGNGCTNSTPINIPSVQVIANFTTTIISNQVAFSNMSANASNYQWEFGDGGTSVIVNPVHNYATVGIFSPCLIASGTCGADTFCSNITILSLIVSNSLEEELSLYPNPTTNHIILQNVGGPLEPTTIAVSDVFGRLVQLQRLATLQYQTTIPLPNCPPGCYIVQVTFGGNLRKSFRLIVE